MEHLLTFSQFLAEAAFRDKKGRYARRPPLPDVMEPRQGETVPFTRTKGVKNLQPPQKRPPRQKPQTPEKPQMTAQRELPMEYPKKDKTNARQKDWVSRTGNKPTDNWEQILELAKEDRNMSKEFLTLILALYQARQRNPAIRPEMPRLVQTLPTKTSYDKSLKNAMVSVFNIIKNDDLPHLAARGNDIRRATSSHPRDIKIQASTNADNTMLQQLYGLIRKATPQTLEQVKKVIEKELKARKPEPELPPRPHEKPMAIGMA